MQLSCHCVSGNVLPEQTPYAASLPGMRESSAASEPITLPDITHGVFLLLLEYIYTDQVGDIGSRLAVPLLIAAASRPGGFALAHVCLCV